MKSQTTSQVGDVAQGLFARLLRIACFITVAASLLGAASAQHLITTTPGSGGNIFPTGPITVPAGTKTLFFVIPNTGFSIQDVMVNGTTVGKSSQVPVGPVSAAVTITASFVKSPTITASVVGTGTISPTGSDTVGYGGSRTFNMQAAIGNMLSALTVNNVPVTLPAIKPAQFSHTVNNIIANTTVKATFAVDPTKVLLTSTAGVGGSILPLGKVEALKSSSRSYTITPAAGFYILDVKVDGKSVGKVSFHTLTNIQKAQTIAATFAKNPVITATQATGGTITPLGASTVSYGSSKSYTITPASGHEIVNVVVDGKPVADTDGFYTVTNIIKNTTFSAVFRARTTHVFVTSTAGVGGTISPLGKVGVLKGANQSFTITPATGYRILGVKVGATSVGAVTSHTLTNVQAAQTIAATFAKNPVVSVKQAVGGTVTPMGDISVPMSGALDITATPQTGYEVVSLSVSGHIFPLTTNLRISPIEKNLSVSAVFKQRADFVTVTTTAGTGGTITPPLGLTVTAPGKVLAQKGTSPVFTITPAANYRVLDVKIGTVSQGAVTTVTVPNMQANTTLAATFIKLPIITATQSTGGSILPAGSKVLPMAGGQVYTINPTLGYKIDNLIVDGKTVADTDGSFGFTNVIINHTISAKFSLTTHVVNTSSPPAGTLLPAGPLNILSGKDQTFTVTPPAGSKAGIRVNGVLKAQKPGGGPLTYVLKNIRRNYQVEAVFAPIGFQFAGTLGIAPVGLGDTINVANKTPALFNLLTNGTLGVAGVYYHNVTATQWGQAMAGAIEDNWTASVPMIPGDNEIWFAAVGTGGEVAWYPTVVTYYPASDFTTPLTPYVGGLPLSTLTVGSPTTVTWKLGLLSPAGAVVTLYQVGAADALTQLIVMTDNGVLPDEIQGDGIFTGNTSITANTSGYLYYRVGVVKPGPVTYYSETKELWSPPPLTDDKVNVAGEAADNTATDYDALIAGGDTPQEAAAAVVEDLKQDPNIGAAGATEDGGVWWITEDGILGLHHPELDGQKVGGGAAAIDRGAPPPLASQEQVSAPAQSPFYSTADMATLFTPSLLTGGMNQLSAAAPPPPLSSDGKNRVKSDRAIIISPFINNPNGGNFGNNDDYYKPWPTIQAHKTCGLYAAREVLNNGAVTVTLGDFKNLSGYGYIHISTHGDNYYNGLLSLWEDTWGPNDFLKGNLSIVGLNSGIQLFKVDGKYVLGAYADDLNAKRLAIGKSGKLYMLPQFFKDYLSPLPNSLVILSACRSGYNGSLMSVFLSKGAGTVIGYTDYVATSYTRNTLQEVVDRMYEDKTALEAMQSAVGKYGSDDADADPAALVYVGATDLRFPNSTLTNGGFEDGIIEPWERTGDGRIITGLGIERPKEGKFMGIISTGLGFTTASGSIQQRLCVPDAGGVLSFRWSMYSEEWLEYVGSQFQDAFSVSVAIVDPVSGAVGAFSPLFTKTVDGLAGQVIPADVGFDRGGVYKTTWRIDMLNFNTYAGKTIVLKFGCTDVGDSIYDSAVLLDEIQFLPGATPPP
ncbi:MAG: hypothetical protein ABL974_01055 [Prosthecobacter sp.]